MLKNKYIIAITGHRDMIITKILQVKIKKFIDKAAKQYEEVVLLSALAEGADSVVAKIFIDRQEQYRHLKLEVPLPFVLEEYTNHYSMLEKQNFSTLIGHASSYYIIPKRLDNPYKNLGEYLVNNADILLALWDGVDNGKTGGTADVVAYAKSQKKPIKHLLTQRKYK